MNYSLDDTIAAIATAPGEAGIGIVRVSGPGALAILQGLFRPAAPAWQPESHRMSYGWLASEAGEPLDELMAVWFQAPRSYTREDVVELHSHGGSVAVRQALARVLRAGARLAEPGEMTLRAFLNGRLDLAQAEAVLDVVRARTEVGMQAAMEQLGGALSQEIRAARQLLLEVLAHLTATIDFPEDDVPPQDISPELREVRAALERLLENAEKGILLREGLRVAIVGRPNVGKSSLLNRLLRHERAIVTNIPGTTRDLLEESLNLRGIPIVLTDTAGIRDTVDVVEAIGVARSRGALQQADLILLVLDASAPLTEQDHALADAVAGRPVIVVENKQDQLRQPTTDDRRPTTDGYPQGATDRRATDTPTPNPQPSTPNTQYPIPNTPYPPQRAACAGKRAGGERHWGVGGADVEDGDGRGASGGGYGADHQPAPQAGDPAGARSHSRRAGGRAGWVARRLPHH